MKQEQNKIILPFKTILQKQNNTFQESWICTAYNDCITSLPYSIIFMKRMNCDINIIQPLNIFRHAKRFLFCLRFLAQLEKYGSTLFKLEYFQISCSGSYAKYLIIMVAVMSSFLFIQQLRYRDANIFQLPRFLL